MTSQARVGLIWGGATRRAVLFAAVVLGTRAAHAAAPPVGRLPAPTVEPAPQQAPPEAETPAADRAPPDATPPAKTDGTDTSAKDQPEPGGAKTGAAQPGRTGGPPSTEASVPSTGTYVVATPAVRSRVPLLQHPEQPPGAVVVPTMPGPVEGTGAPGATPGRSGTGTGAGGGEASGANASPGAAEPAPVVKVEYVPGYRYILSAHRENYFISGFTGAEHVVKFQYSVKFDLWPNATRHSLYFGFTQKSLWRLWDFSASSPFVESNYAPEVFYGYYSRIGDLPPQPGRVIPFLDRVNAGLEHESNGQDGMASRGWNRFNASVRGGLYFGLDHYIALTPRGWLPPFDKDDNKDITDYLGYGSLTFEYGYDPAEKAWWGGGNIGATAWKAPNRDLSRGAIEAWLNWRPAYSGKFVEWWKFTPYFYVQGYFGYGETLLQYNQSVSSIRVGLALEDRVNWVTVVHR